MVFRLHYPKEFILELQFLKIFATDEGHDLKINKSNGHKEVYIQDKNKMANSQTKKTVFSVAILIILILTWSVVSTHNVLEKKFDYTFSEFEKDQMCVTRTIASFKVEGINKFYTCPSEKKCRVKKEKC